MEIDAKLLEGMHPDDPPLVHLYEWEGSAATYGYFLDPANFLDVEQGRRLNLSLARRPTGGGITFHVSDFAFSVLVPAHFPHYSTKTLSNYNFINNRVKCVVKNLIENKESLMLLPEETLSLDEYCPHFCMAKPTKYDVMLGERKIAGAAQRRRRQGYLHQGSISVALPKKDFLDQILLKGTRVQSAMEAHTFSLLGQDWTQKDLEEVRKDLKYQLQRELTR